MGRDCVQLQSFSDFDAHGHLSCPPVLEHTIKLASGTSAWRIGPIAPEKPPLERIFALTLLPEKYAVPSDFEWHLEAVEIPTALQPACARPQFVFDAASESKYVRVR